MHAGGVNRSSAVQMVLCSGMRPPPSSIGMGYGSASETAPANETDDEGTFGESDMKKAPKHKPIPESHTAPVITPPQERKFPPVCVDPKPVEPAPVVESVKEPRKEWIPEPPKYAVLVEISPKDIERIVSMALADGWKLAGGLVTVTESGTTRWAQAVTK